MDFEDENNDNFGSRFGREDEGESDEDDDPFADMFEGEEINHRQEEDVPQKAGMAHRGTFVGTPLYASPEMLNNSVSGPFTDLWALGVIVYQMITGEVPWKGNKDFIIFQQILERKVQFPNTMSEEAVDFINKLL
mgnify:FL=1